MDEEQGTWAHGLLHAHAKLTEAVQGLFETCTHSGDGVHRAERLNSGNKREALF